MLLLSFRSSILIVLVSYNRLIQVTGEAMLLIPIIAVHRVVHLCDLL
jgi:hypothetical protein